MKDHMFNNSGLISHAMRLEMEGSLADWQAWAMDRGIDPMLITFLHLRPDRFSNITPRAWCLAAAIPETLPSDQYLTALEGVVGKEIAAEYVAFRCIAKGESR